MLGTYSYNEIFRKTIIAFGTLFNNIELRRQDEVMKVPLAYGPKQKFLARLDQNPDPTNKRVAFHIGASPNKWPRRLQVGLQNRAQSD